MGFHRQLKTGLYYLQSRYYDPQTGRFINADGLLATTGATQALNLFAYCNNNPVNASDPTGMMSDKEYEMMNPQAQAAYDRWRATHPSESSDSPAADGKVSQGKKPPPSSGYRPPKKGNPWDSVKHGWVDQYGNTWIPDPSGHAGDHWDVTRGDGRGYINVGPDGKTWGGKGLAPKLPVPPLDSTATAPDPTLGIQIAGGVLIAVAIIGAPFTDGASLLLLLG